MKKFIFSFILLFISIAHAQNIERFPFGVYLSATPYPVTLNGNYEQVKQLGVSWVEQRAQTSNKYLLESNFDGIIANNITTNNPNEWINYYTNGFYKRWEAEETVVDTLPGIKHKFGEILNIGNVTAWAVNDSPPRDSLIYGPHYYQEKIYKFLFDKRKVDYLARFRIKLIGAPLEQGNNPVCKLSIVFRYRDGENGWQIAQRTLNETIVYSDTLSDIDFTNINMGYSYPAEFKTVKPYRLFGEETNGIKYDDSEIPDIGIQFRIDWLGNWKIAIDYIEVYDDRIGRYFTENYGMIESNVLAYANQFNDWSKINYWYVLDEPNSIDNYEPIRRINEILINNNKPPAITAYYPRWNGSLNGAKTYNQFVQLTQPSLLMTDYYPFYYEETPNPHQNIDVGVSRLRERLQEAHEAFPGFFYVAPTFSQWDKIKEDSIERKPEYSELRSIVMLALAHGAKGIFFWNYYSYDSDERTIDALVGLPDNGIFPTYPLYDSIKNSLSPRINGILGNTLLKLNYTGNYLNFSGGNLEGTVHTNDYLSIWQGNQHVFYHAGLLEDKNDAKNKYFIIINELTNPEDGDRVADIFINKNHTLSGHQNWRVRNIEENYDTTLIVNDHLNFQQMISAGDAKLFQVAPVIKYGGNLIADETISAPTTLHEDMTIESGATLYVNSQYTANANIIVKSGGKIIGGNNSSLVFTQGHQLTVDGNAELYGSANNRLQLIFPNFHGAGIVVKPTTSLNISFCEIQNARYGIVTESHTGSINIDNLNFVNCTDYGIVLLGSSRRKPDDQEVTVRNCSIENSSTAIHATNYGEIIIQQNSITNCGLGISLLSISAAHVGANVLQSQHLENNGIIMVSSNGNIFGNSISGFTNGIYLSYSSPNIGLNTLK